MRISLGYPDRAAERALLAEGVAPDSLTVAYQLDVRYQGQGMRLSIDVNRAAFEREGLAGVARRFDDVHAQLYTFALEAEHELVSLRAIVQGPETLIRAERMETDGANPVAAEIDRSRIFVDGAWHEARLFDRVKKGTGATGGEIWKMGSPMPPNSAVKDEDIKTLVKWILAGAPAK